MERGYIKIWRKIVNSIIWQDPLVFQTWWWIIKKANWKKTEVLVGKRIVICDRGQFVTGIYKACGAVPKLKPKKWRNTLELLTRANKIRVQPHTKFTLITVLNYDLYQPLNNDENSEKGNQRAIKGQSKGNQRATENNKNKLKELKGQDLKNLAKNVSSSLSFTEKTKTNQSRKEKTNWKPNTKGANKMSKGDPGFEAREANRKLVKKEWVEKDAKKKKEKKKC